MGKRCWVLTDGRAGNVAQATGLAEAVGYDFEAKTVQFPPPFHLLPAGMWPKGQIGLNMAGSGLGAPWPDLLIACGRRAVGSATAIRRLSRGKTFLVQILDPKTQLDKFDLVVAPFHDRINGANVIVTHGSVGRVNRTMLDRASERFKDRFADLPRPVVAVSIGGSNKVFAMDEATAEGLADQVAAMAEATGCSLLVTPSRRTGKKNTRIFRDKLARFPGEFWDGTGENPYFGYLGCADSILVTGDSVNMVSEACATGKPVHVMHLPARRKTKFNLFHNDLEQIGATRPFSGELAHWDYQPLDETRRAADSVLRHLNAQDAELII